MLKLFALLVILNYPHTPDQQMTPGSICTQQSPDFDGLRYDEQIPHCNRNVTTSQKAKIYEAYGIPEVDRNQFTIDHLIPLSLGGSNASSNLWPEAKILKQQERPALEQYLYNEINAGEITQEAAIKCILKAKFTLEKCD